jgi:PAS domain S-box-containing protein
MYVLMAEDEASHAEAVRRSLESAWGRTEIRVVSTLREYREQVALRIPDIALVDLNLPDGRAVEILTSPPETGTHPVLIMTSHGNEATAVEAMRAGALDYLVKSPESFADIPRVVERILREWALLGERQENEKALEESQRLFSEVANASPALIWMSDPIGRCVWFNRPWLDFTGRTPEEEYGDGWAEGVHPEDLERCVSIYREAFGARRDFSMEYRLRRHDGEYRWIFDRGCPRHDREGKFRGYIGTCMDVTERKQAEAERDRAKEDLLQAQKMEAVGRLAGGVAHDFNNMLHVILGYVDLTLAGLSPRDPLYDNIQEIRKAARRSADLTRQLLAFSRKQIASPRPMDLNQIVEESREMLRRLIGEGIEYILRPGGELWTIRADPSQIDQILANLAVNARDAIGTTGKIVVETDNTRLDGNDPDPLLHDVRGEFVRLSFGDTGCGMDRITREKIFEPFFTTKDSGRGTGLGLAMVYGIVRQNGGLIHVYSEPGQGTTFRIYFPRWVEEDEEEPDRAEAEPKRGDETLLIVEDEIQILRLAERTLKRSGYETLAARTPEEAIRLVEEHRGTIHLLLSDVVMPGMNGKELRERIERIKPGIRTLFMSGYTADVIAHHGILDPGVRFLQKPFSLDELTRKVRETLEG